MPGSTAIVSVIVPAYNGERTILKTLASILQQKYTPIELIVIDDGSKDKTCSLVKSFMSTNKLSPNFRLLEHEHNQGLSRTLNDGINIAQGEFVLILHQDCELVGDSWLEKAVSLTDDKDVAVVTGYYGIPDAEEETLVKRAFGILRKQFHTRPQASFEEATFSEGKCDLYRKQYLSSIGNFPTGYRIAGEDLIVSYALRKKGYKILKCYDLPVIQRFTGQAETFNGNLRKEFLFGKVMGGVFSRFKLFLFKSAKNSEYSGSRSLHRATQPIFVISFFALLLLTAWSQWLALAVLALLLYRYAYYIKRVFGEYNNRDRVKNPRQESLIAALIGILTDFSYSFGFGYGLLRNSLHKDL